MIVVIDYRAGNLYNVGHALRYLKADFVFSGDPAVVGRATKVILPGVGSAQQAMESLSEQGLVEVLRDLNVPFLGICLGQQLLFEMSDEERTPCLGIVPGTVSRFNSDRVKVPHIGWNQVALAEGAKEASKLLFKEVPDGKYFYFVHSYFAPVQDCTTLATTEHGTVFASAMAKDNYWGVQFHPERSGEAGLKLLGNFLRMDC